MKSPSKKKSAVLFTSLALVTAIIFSNCRNQTDTNFTPLQSCIVDSSALASWFHSDTISPNGRVTPANSLDPKPPLTKDCNFYKWSWRNFLWLTSKKENEGQYVFNSASFFDFENHTLVPEGSAFRVRDQKFGAPGQAGEPHEVLMSQNRSLVYYAIQVNGVYASFRKAKIDHKLQDSSFQDFPTNAAQLKSIAAYAKTQNYKLSDDSTLAMELKSSWVKASTLDDPSRYLIIKAKIPKYQTLQDSLWTWDGTSYEQKDLALVGFHLVGSAADNPEMIWATFEHVDNGPNGSYTYYNTDSILVTKDFTENIEGNPSWIFTKNGSTVSECNHAHMKLSGNNIKAQTHHSISPSTTFRANPWGSIKRGNPTNNTRLIAINESIRNKLQDVRKNYFLLGAIWTQNGEIPNDQNEQKVTAGSNYLLNMTMETYFQGNNPARSCFSCHSVQKGKPGVGLSHIYPHIKEVILP